MEDNQKALTITINNHYCLPVPKIPEGEFRPLWSVIIPVYNCAEYLKQSLVSVLQQDPGPEKMEIIVVDDCSTKDDPEKIVKEIGCNRVYFYRQKENVGKSRNYATGLKLSKGRLIHILHGDDYINEGFYRKMETLYYEYPEVSAYFCQCSYVNKDNLVLGSTGRLSETEGILENFVNRIAAWQIIQPPSIIFRREAYEKLGGYDNRLPYMEDWEFYVRVSVFFKFAYTPEILANYRVFPESSSQQSKRGGKRLETLKKTMTIINEYLPDDVIKIISRERNRSLSVYLISLIPDMICSGDLKGYLRVTLMLFRYNYNMRLWMRYLRFIVRCKKFRSVNI